MKHSVLQKIGDTLFSCCVLGLSAAVLLLGKPSLSFPQPRPLVSATADHALAFDPQPDIRQGSFQKKEDTAKKDSAIAADAPCIQPALPTVRPAGFGNIIASHYGAGSGTQYLTYQAACLRNATSLPREEVQAEMGKPLPFSIEKNSSEPQVLIMHTHATESFELQDVPWFDPAYSARSTVYEENITAVGEQLCKELNAAGICTLQDKTYHDYPSYNGSYERSCRTVESYLAQYPSIKIVLDVHRDAIERDGVRYKPVAEIDGKSAAQVMIISGADDGTMGMPHYKENLRFACLLQNAIESRYPGLTRPILFDYRHYNQHLTTGSLLLEIGGHANTLEEAMYCGSLVGKSLAAMLCESAD